MILWFEAPIYILNIKMNLLIPLQSFLMLLCCKYLHNHKDENISQIILPIRRDTAQEEIQTNIVSVLDEMKALIGRLLGQMYCINLTIHKCVLL